MKELIAINAGWGITIVRIAASLVFIAHGYRNFAGGLANMSAAFAKLALPLPGVTAPFIAVLNLVGGSLLLVGVATRWLGLLFAIEMSVATVWVGFPARGWNGSELERMLLATGLLFLIAGPGALAIDQVWLEKTE